jgi:hypothetical protein
MANKPDSPYVWASWLPRLMVGDTSHDWFIPHMANYHYDAAPADTDFSDYRINHTRLLRELADECEASGARVTIEDQNTFRYRRPSGLVLHGKPDLVSDNGDTARVIDAKTGKARDADRVQVKLYMYGLRKCLPEYQDRPLAGQVVYQAGGRIDIEPGEVDSMFEDNLHYWLDVIERPSPPRRVPSEGNCRFCKISSRDCPDRIVQASEGYR